MARELAVLLVLEADVARIDAVLVERLGAGRDSPPAACGRCSGSRRPAARCTPCRARRSRMWGTALAASSRSTVMRTSSEPARSSAATCAAVPAMSAVSVLVMDCTTTGAPPPNDHAAHVDVRPAPWRQMRGRSLHGSCSAMAPSVYLIAPALGQGAVAAPLCGARRAAEDGPAHRKPAMAASTSTIWGPRGCRLWRRNSPATTLATANSAASTTMRSGRRGQGPGGDGRHDRETR